MVPTDRVCKKCGETKPLDQFVRASDCLYGRGHECSACKRARSIAYSREWKKRNPDYGREYRERTGEARLAYHREKYRALKAEVIAAYGGECRCCGESEVAFLTIDHVFNDGAQHRSGADRSSGVSIYRSLKRDGFPRGRYQVLCYNCNCSKQHDPVGHRRAHPRAWEVDGGAGDALGKQDPAGGQRAPGGLACESLELEGASA